MTPDQTPFEKAYRDYYARMKELLASRPDLVAADPDNEREPRYFFRPDEVVIHKGDLEQLSRSGALDDFVRKEPVRYADDARSGTPLPYAVYESHAKGARALVDRVRQVRSDNRNARFGLNHVVFGLPHSGCPAGPPSPCDPPPPPEGTDGAGVLVGVVDTGWWPKHPWLAGRTGSLTSAAADTEQATAPLGLQAGHGTHVCGVVARMAPGARIVVAGALDADGLADDATVSAALARMIACNVRVVNMSLGCFTEDDLAPKALAAVLETMPPDMALIAGAGNKDTTRRMYPAAFCGAFGVGALDDAGARAYFSNWGPWVDACARGVEVPSSFLEAGSFGGYATWSGTSFAAPQLAGAVAARVSQTGEAPRVAATALIAAGRVVPGLGSELSPQLP